MPRITTQEHYRRHKFLRMLWCEPGLDIFFSLLSVPAQWQLHEYYCPSEDLNEAEFKEYCQAIDIKFPQLRHVVGKNFKVIENFFIAASKVFGVDQAQMNQAVALAVARNDKTPKRPRSKNNTHKQPSSSSGVHIAAIVKPPNVEKLGMAFLKLAEEYRSRKQNGES